MTVERQSISMSPDHRADEAQLLAAASRGDREAFAQLGEPYRRELRLHCYRMLGSFHEAEDLVQDTYLRAWRSVEHFEARASFRTWLYRIATNACLNVLAARAPRILPETRGATADGMPGRTAATEIPWLEPYPDAALEGLADARPGPEARYALRESVQLAFIAAIQHLPPRQRAALLLHDVLGWSAAEIAHLLATSVAGVNSALQRARATLDRERSGDHMPAATDWDRSQDALLDRYLRAWEAADADGFAALLRDDAVLSMPPWPEWYRGRAAIRAFFAWTARPGGHGPFRLVATRANQQPAFAFYSRGLGAPEWRAHSLQLVTAHDDAILHIVSFVTGSLVTACGLPEVLPGQSSSHVRTPSILDRDSPRPRATIVGGVSESISRSIVAQTSIALVEDLRVDGPCTPAPRAESYSPDYQLSFPYRGFCIWHVGRDQVVADPNRVKFIAGDEGYRVSRPVDGGHSELLVTASRHVFAELLRVDEAQLRRHDLFVRRTRPSDATMQRMAAELVLTGTEAMSPLAADERVLALLRRALIVNELATPTPATMRVLARVKEYLAAHLASRVRLPDVAAVAGLSAVYLTAQFKRFEGVSLHRYLVRLRLARALVEVPHTSDLTRLAHDLGFSHHSHFTSAFRRAFGCTPSAFRTATSRTRLALPPA